MRYFTFGCSFTKYSQGSTWADIYAYQNNLEHYNHGEGGASNLFIASRVHEAIHFYDINEDDEIGICWTFLGRNKHVKPDVELAICQGVINTLQYKKIPHKIFYVTNLLANLEETDKIKGQMLKLLYSKIQNDTLAYTDIQKVYNGRRGHPTIKEHIQMLQKNNIIIDKPRIFEHANQYNDKLNERTPKLTKNHVDSYFRKDIDNV